MKKPKNAFVFLIKIDNKPNKNSFLCKIIFNEHLN
jgi:hypothetical protein